MKSDSHGVPAEPPAHRPFGGNMRLISWNLLRLVGAGVRDVANLIERHRPDILLMQEATEELADLPNLVGGHFFREPMHGRVYGLAAWSPRELSPPKALRLPVSTMPGRVPPRVAQIVRVGDVTLANVHLSHGQVLNRLQLLRIARTLEGCAAIVGDYNAVGPIKLDGFKDIGPRRPTHIAGNIISFRLDRCMARGLRCVSAQVLERGPSDHHPIILDLDTVAQATPIGEVAPSTERRRFARVGMANWLRSLSLPTSDIRIWSADGQTHRSKSKRRSSTSP